MNKKTQRKLFALKKLLLDCLKSAKLVSSLELCYRKAKANRSKNEIEEAYQKFKNLQLAQACVSFQYPLLKNSSTISVKVAKFI